MSLMGRIAKLDSAMQRGLDNSFAFVFGGRVVPAELEELLKQEAQDNLVRTYEDTVEAPNVFHIYVSEKDAAHLVAEHPSLPQDFADQLTRYHRNQGWITPGVVTVTIEPDSSLRTGQLQAKSSTDPQPTQVSGYIKVNHLQVNNAQPQAENDSPATPVVAPAPPSAPIEDPAPPTMVQHIPQATSKSTVSLLLQDGSSRTYLVHEGSNIIGRSNEVDFRLPDTGVSRQHAEITWNGQDAILVDLQSTNGTVVNDTPIDNWLLADGDVITVGHSHIEVRIVFSS